MSVGISNKEVISARNWHPSFMKGIEAFIAFRPSSEHNLLKYKENTKICISGPNWKPLTRKDSANSVAS